MQARGRTCREQTYVSKSMHHIDDRRPKTLSKTTPIDAEDVVDDLCASKAHTSRNKALNRALEVRPLSP
jgi:hypothetical protein